MLGERVARTSCSTIVSINIAITIAICTIIGIAIITTITIITIAIISIVSSPPSPSALSSLPDTPHVVVLYHRRHRTAWL